MVDRSDIRTSCLDLQVRLQSDSSSDAIKPAYLDLSIVLGRLHGALNEEIRIHGHAPRMLQAQREFDSMSKIVRQVGFDLRLASPPALRLGLQTALAGAIHLLDVLDRPDN